PTATPTAGPSEPPTPTAPAPTPTLPAPQPAAQAQPGSAPPAAAQPAANTLAVPSVVGMAEADARRALQAAGFNVGPTNFQSINDVLDKATFNRTQPGRVLSQTPAGGATVSRGSTINIAVRRS